MKLQRTTLVLVILALGLGTAVYLTEGRGTDGEQTVAQGEGKRVFRFAEKDVQTFKVITPNLTLSVERSPEEAKKAIAQLTQASAQKSEKKPQPTGTEKSPKNQPKNQSEKQTDKPSKEEPKVPQESPTDPPLWMIRAPEKGVADNATVAFLLNLLSTAKSNNQLAITPEERQDFGLEKPWATVEVTLKNGKSHKIFLGLPNFDRAFLYALIDPPEKTEETVEVVLVPVGLETAVERPIKDWQYKPPVTPSEQSDSAPALPTPGQSPSQPTQSEKTPPPKPASENQPEKPSETQTEKKSEEPSKKEPKKPLESQPKKPSANQPE